MLGNYRRLKAVHFLNKMYDIMYFNKDLDALSVVILLEVISHEIATDGFAGITPATLARAHNLSPETARRRLLSLEKNGWVERRKGKFFVPEVSSIRDDFDSIVLQFELYSQETV